ncbi:hypothetical protein [Streptomyces mirabilis]|uniref:hypothetical protein n=1 Tax=Streptomyces mirabilis TaxID=68239 RepID=UPI0036DEF403
MIAVHPDHRATEPVGPVGTPAAAAGPVVLACVPGEQHSLALEALHAGLVELGLPTRMARRFRRRR